MRKAQKQDVLGCVESLHQAHEEIKEALKRKDTITAQNMLSESQEFAVSLGENIEKLEGEGHVVVSCLEEYCEMLYCIYSELNTGKANVDHIYKTLRKQLLKVEDCIKNDICVKKEIVFLPYKASMWDSLESVWKAADADKDVDAYVISIPYFDKNPDGSLGEMHYEADQYPVYVPIMQYTDYDFEKNKPDIIFIHNPYDECNYVTSVLPYFYSKNLKQFTEQLIYIPYFVLGEIKPDNKQAIEGIKHFCLLPGVVNADKVIVQSENMRQIYISVLAEMTGGKARSYWEKKILGLGSPKYDKVADTRKDELEVPEEWMRIIKKPDGNWKKIVLYNIGVSALLKYDRQVFIKMRDVFRVLKENKSEVALLWRPHPLIRATIESMRPELREEYEGIVDQYKEEGWGIYDDTTDVERAIALSDAYYGDWSSLVQLYEKTGKPMMIQDLYSLPCNNCSLAMDNIVEHQGEWWFLALKDNSIYKMKKDTLEAVFVKRIPYRMNCVGEHPQYGKIYIHKNKVFVLPMIADAIAVYDVKKDQIHYIDYGYKDLSRGTLFLEEIEYKNKLYLIPSGFDYMVSIDLDTEEIGKINMQNIFSIHGKLGSYAWGNIYWDGRKLILTQLTGKNLMYMDFETGEKEVFECDHLEGGGGGVCGDKDSIWIIPRKTGKILCWDRKRKKLEIYSEFPNGYQAGDWSFYKVLLGDELYLLPRDANMCIAVNKETGNMRNITPNIKEMNMNSFLDRYMPYTNVWKNGNDILMISSKRGSVFVLKREEIIKVENIKVIREYKSKFKWHGVVYERQNCFDNIENYIQNGLFCVQKITTERGAGDRIYNNLMKKSSEE